MLILLVLCTWQFVPKAFAQEATKAEAQSPEVRLITLAPPIFPPLARTARIMGDVGVELLIKKDGSIESARVVSGHQILAPSALESAKQSKFECHGCHEESTAYTLIYTYDLSDPVLAKPDPCCCSHPAPAPSVIQSANHIIIHGGVLCVCPDECASRQAEKDSQYRSFKCLYLWKCGNHQYGIE